MAKDLELAFPSLDVREDGYRVVETGMSLRDYFAAKALTGILLNLEAASLTVIRNEYRMSREECEMAYRIADEMLEARKK